MRSESELVRRKLVRIYIRATTIILKDAKTFDGPTFLEQHVPLHTSKLVRSIELTLHHVVYRVPSVTINPTPQPHTRSPMTCSTLRRPLVLRTCTTHRPIQLVDCTPVEQHSRSKRVYGTCRRSAIVTDRWHCTRLLCATLYQSSIALGLKLLRFHASIKAGKESSHPRDGASVP